MTTTETRRWLCAILIAAGTQTAAGFGLRGFIAGFLVTVGVLLLDSREVSR